jgi:hypothetical protein
MNYTVYKHTVPNGKVYIGITNRKPQTRWGKDGIGYKRNEHFYNAIKKYGWDSIRHEILFSNLSKEVACQMEIDLIKLYDSTNREKGYNKSVGGSFGYAGVKTSDETKKKQSLAHKGKSFSDYHKKRLSESHKGSGHGGFATGRVVSDEIKEKIAIKHRIPIKCVQTNKTFESITEASQIMNLNKSAICHVLKGKRTHTCGYSFVYLEKGCAL